MFFNLFISLMTNFPWAALNKAKASLTDAVICECFIASAFHFALIIAINANNLDAN